MTTRSISSTQVQNNFGHVLDDVISTRTRYVIERWGIPQAVLLHIDELAVLFTDEQKRQELETVLKGLRRESGLGRPIDTSSGSE